MENTYWNGNGKFEALRTKCFEEMKSRGEMDFEFSHFHQRHKNPEWGLLNGMAGIYYGYFNDGDNVKGAIENNRVHGYECVEDFLRTARRVGAPQIVINYIQNGGRGKKNLENAMDATIQFVAEKMGVRV